MTAVAALGGGLALAAAAGGVACLRRAWRRPRPVRLTLLGWGLMAAGWPLWALGSAPDKAAALAILAPSPFALLLVARAVKVRPPRAPGRERAAPSVPDVSGQGWSRALLRTLFGGPLAAAAAALPAAAWALKGPVAPADRLVEAGLLAPALWAIGLIWATTDPRLARVGGGLLALAALGGAAAAL